MRRAKGVVSALVALAAGLLIGQGCSVADQTGSADIPDGGAETGDDDATTAKPVCGDGVTAEPEQCDDANHVNGDGCDDDCTFSCDPADPNRGLTKCDKNPCRGALSCSAAHVCTYGTASPNGASCGDGKICNNGSCASAVCGDGFVTPPEECDDSNAKDGDGCDTTCTFSCVPNDPKRDCAPKDACAGQGTCNAGTHVCAAGTPLPNGTSCGAAGSGDVCKGGVCAAPSCGDGIVEAPEDCDFGAGNGVGTGCEANCKFSCSKTPESCVTVDLCAGTNACTTVTVSGATGQKCVTGAPPPDGTACGTGGTCSGGLCRMATCGNGTIETGEQCDFGAGNNGPGTGCELDCQFSCQTAPTDSCPGSDPCSASPQKCSPVTVAGHPGQKCAAQPVLAQCASCGGANICVGNVCKANQCGDTCVAGTETCDPPNGTTCSASCTTIVCGDGKREGLEQCDDGQSPPLNLDGCDSTCKFEQDHRANSVTLLYNPSTLCATNNALGSAIASVAQGQLQTSLSNGVKDGSTTIMLKFAGLMDLTGTNQPNVQVGGLGGKVVAGPGYDGTKDLEWWYTTDPTSIDGSRNPKTFLTGSIAAKLLDVTGTIDLGISLSGGPTIFHLSGAHLRSNVGATSKPLISANQSTPGHLVSENLDPALVSFATMSTGELCGNISAASLATVPVPNALLTGFAACSQGYTAQNHLLDVLVHGCNGAFGITEVNPTQPDQVDPAAPPAGQGAPYTLAVTGTTVTTCRDKTGATVNLAACLTAAAYSSDFNFTTDRVIAK